jgi:surface carbohydrate biosynthesis protein
LLPIEIKAREFHAKVLQAAVAAERGFAVVLGEQNALVRQTPWLPRGLYIDKSVSRTKTKPFRRLRALGNRIAAWCEEGLVYRDRDTYLHERVSNDSLALVERFFAWGEAQADAVRLKAPEAADKIRVAGNPRFDVLRPELRGIFAPDVVGIRARYGPTILVATNFSRYNHFMGAPFWIDALRQRGTIQSAQQVAFFERWRDYLGVLYRNFAAMLPLLCRAFPQHTIIVRPHPSENHDAWRREIAGLHNAVVAFEGNAIPWIVAADVLIHNSCTTGVEAYMLGRPVVTYRPVTDEVLDSHLPNALSREARTPDDLTALVHDGLSGTLSEATGARAEMARYVASLNGALAAEQVAEAIAGLGIAPTPYRPSLGDRLRLAGDAVASNLTPLVRTLRVGRRAEAYALQKFPGITLAEVQEALRRTQEVSGRFAGITARPLPAHDCFHIERSAP